MIARINQAKELIAHNKKPLKVISHFDTDGITSAAIFSRVLQRWDIPFSLEIVKNLTTNYVNALDENQTLVFLDLASGMLQHLAKKKTDIIILDHHEIKYEIPDNVIMVNPHNANTELVATSALCYLFGKEVSEQNEDLSTLAVIGMIGDMFETHIGKTYDQILKDADVTKKQGLLLYPATRPIDRVLEGSYSFFIPDVTGSYKGVIELLKDAGIEKTQKGYKSIAELSDKEMEQLVTTIMLKKDTPFDTNSLVGNIFLINFFSRMEDARELSAIINACSRMGQTSTALGFCLQNSGMREQAEKVYLKYKRTIAHALGVFNKLPKITGPSYIIVEAGNEIPDTIIGTIASIISFSPVSTPGTVIVAAADDSQNEGKVKVSARVCGRVGRNVRELLDRAVMSTTESAEVGGHAQAAGCILEKNLLPAFIKNLQALLDVEVIKMQGELNP